MTGSASWQTITVDQLKQEMDSGAAFFLVDVLPGEFFEKRRLPGALNACVFEVTFVEQVGRITQDRQAHLILYGVDHSTRDALEAADKLVRDGYRRITILSGGLKAWLEAGYKLEGADPDQAENQDEWLPLEDGVYQALLSECYIGWTGRNANKRHYGTLNLSLGRLELQGGQARGRFEIDLTTIKNIDLEGDEWQPVLLKHLASDDFFWVKRFPKAVFHLTTGLPHLNPEKSSPISKFWANWNSRG